jgi:hypothetical protein
MFKRFVKNMTAQRQAERRAELYRNLIRHEAQIGGQLFGPVPKGGRREFFCLDEHTWVWHEEWVDETGKLQVRTTRYDVRPDGILKAQEGYPYQPVKQAEALHLRQAALLYRQRVNEEIYTGLA